MMQGEYAYLVLLVLAAAEMFAHFALYLAAYRHGGRLSSERAILLYHIKSTTLLVAICATFLIVHPDDRMLAAGLAALFAHGIYSLSFLELWTLSQISYSRDVLSHAARAGPVSRSDLIDRLSSVGDRKKSERLDALLKLGLVRRDDGGWRLGRRGGVIAVVLSVFLWLPSSRSHG